MSSKLSNQDTKRLSREEVVSKAIPHKDFATRLQKAVAGHPRAPEGHGRQAWLREQLVKQNLELSPEAVRKWFAGESRPRVGVITQIAKTLEVDEAWLSLGRRPDASPEETKKRNAVADGVVNVVAGMIQMSGGHIAFPDEGEEGVDIIAIYQGKKIDIEVSLSRDVEENVFRFTFQSYHPGKVFIGAVRLNKTKLEYLRIPAGLVKDHGHRKGGYLDITVQRDGSVYTIEGNVLPVITSFDNLEGVMPRRK